MQDVRGAGVADLAARRARMSQVLMPERITAKFSEPREDNIILDVLSDPRETMYDGANMYMQVAGRWTGFFLTDPAGPRGFNDPLWPLDAMSGANADAVEVGPGKLRDVPVTRYRLTVDLARADAAVPAGVSVPSGPFRALSRVPAEVWLDAAGLIRRAAVSADPTSGDESLTWAIVDLWDFGLAVDIAPLRPDEIVAPGDADWDAAGPQA